MKKIFLIGFMVLFTVLPVTSEAYFGGISDFFNGFKPTCHVYTNPQILNEGADVELHWTSQNATWAVLDTIGTVPVNGSRFLGKVGETKSYSITVGNNFGKSTCSASVHVREIAASSEPETKKLSCTLSVYPDNYIQGATEKVALEWKVENAEFAFINNGLGYVRESTGSILVSPNQTTTYTMEVTKGNTQKAFCSTTLTVSAASTAYHNQSYSNQNTATYNTTRNYNTYGTGYQGGQHNSRTYVRLGYAPYTGADDFAYILMMMTLALASFGFVYRYARKVIV